MKYRWSLGCSQYDFIRKQDVFGCSYLSTRGS